MPVTLTMLTKNRIFGGHIKDIPKPYLLRYPNPYEKREIEITVTVWKIGSDSMGAGGHYHVDIKEENNLIWDVKETKWREPWREDYGTPYRKDWDILAGRIDEIFEYTTPEPCCEWINKVLKEWNITPEFFKLHWNFYGTEDDEEDNQFINNVKLL